MRRLLFVLPAILVALGFLAGSLTFYDSWKQAHRWASLLEPTRLAPHAPPAVPEKGLFDEDLIVLHLPGLRAILALAVGADGVLFAAPAGGGVVTSADGGRTWHSLGLNGRQIRTLVFEEGTLHAGTDAGVFANREAGWEAAGPEGKTIHAIQSDDAGWMYVGTADGVFARTTGGTWQQTLPGEILSLLYSAAGVLYAGTASGLFQSEDGQRWASAGLGNERVQALAETGGAVYAASAAGVYRQGGEGALWTRIPFYPREATYDVRALVVAADGTLHVGTTKGFRMLRQTQFTAPTGWLDSELVVHAMAVETQRGTLYAATADGLYSSSDNGFRWSDSGSTLQRVHGFFLTPGGYLLAATDLGLLASEDRGRSWQLFYPLPPHVAQVLAFEPGTDRMYAGTDGHGVFWQDEDNDTWEGAQKGLENLVVQTLAFSEDALFAGTDGGVLVSRDRGLNWNHTDLRENVWALAAGAEGTLFAGSAGGVYRNRNQAGNQWELVSQPVESPTLQWLDGALYAGMSGKLAVSEDDGQHWTDRASGLPPNPIQSLSLARVPVATQQHSSVWYAGLGLGLYWRREDGGEWARTELFNKHVSAISPDLQDGVLVGLDDGELYLVVYRPSLERAFLTPLFPLAVGVAAALLVAVVYYVLVGRPHRVPLGACLPYLIKPQGWAELQQAPHDYDQYVQRVWIRGTSLEKLITLLGASLKEFSLDVLQRKLAAAETYVAGSRLRSALDALTADGIVVTRARGYALAVPAYAQLARRIFQFQQASLLKEAQTFGRTPLIVNTRRFFQAVGFELDEVCATEFILTTDHPSYKKYGPISAHLFPDEPPHAEDINTIFAQAQKRYVGKLAGKIAIAVVADTPESGARFQIYAHRSEHQFTIIPLSGAVMSKALRHQSCAAEFESQLRQYLGEADLYALNTPVTDVLSFFGRQKLSDQIVALIGRCQPVGLFGLRKMGKTSLMWQLKERLSLQPVACLDLQNAPKDCHLLYIDILSEFVRDLQFKFPHVTLPELETEIAEADAGAHFTRTLLALKQALDDRNRADVRFVLFMDEVERMLPSKGDPGFSHHVDFLATLRGLAQRHQFFVPIVISVDARISRTPSWAGRDNPTLKFFQEVFLPPFEREECGEMVTNIGEQMGIKYSPESLAALYLETGGHPFVTRQLCSLIVKALPQRPATVVPGDVAAAANVYIETRDPYLESLWERFSSLEERVMVALAERGCAHLADFLSADADPAKKRALREALLDLTEKHLICKRGDGYAICFPILHKWVRVEMLDLDPGDSSAIDEGASDATQSV